MENRPGCVGVVIAAFNPGAFLAIALDSLIAQTFHDWQAVVVDDGSDEDLGWVAALDSRIVLVRQANAGVSAARNRGVADTESELIAFLDQDDVWLPTYLERQVEMMANPAVVMSSTEFAIIDARGAVIAPGYSGHHSSYEELLCGCGLQLSTVMVRRSAFVAVGGFRGFDVSQDWDLWLRLARPASSEIRRVDEVLGYWRQHSLNGSRNYVGLWRDGRAILRSHEHPYARVGLRRVRQLSGYQAFDAARDRERGLLARLHALLWAGAHAPRYTVASLCSRIMGASPLKRKNGKR